MRGNALGPRLRSDNSGHWSKGGEEIVSDLGAGVELGQPLLCRLPVECPHPHPQPWEDHQGQLESLGGINLASCSWFATSGGFQPATGGQKKGATVFSRATIVSVVVGARDW